MTGSLPDWASALTSALDSRMGLELLEVSAERVVGRMPVEGNTQPFGLWHGGASCVLAETLASIGATAHGMPAKVAVGVDLNATHHKAVRDGLGHRDRDPDPSGVADRQLRDRADRRPGRPACAPPGSPAS